MSNFVNCEKVTESGVSSNAGHAACLDLTTVFDSKLKGLKLRPYVAKLISNWFQLRTNKAGCFHKTKYCDFLCSASTSQISKPIMQTYS